MPPGSGRAYPTRALLVLLSSLFALLLGAKSARAERVLVVEPPRSDTTLSEAFNRLRAELALQDFEVTVATNDEGPISKDTLEAEAKKRGAFAGILLERSPGGATAEVCIADRITGKTLQRRLAINDPRRAPNVLAVRSVDLLRSSLRELEPDERPPPDVVGVKDEPVAPALRAFSEEPRRFQLRAGAGLIGALSKLGGAMGASLGFFYRPERALGVGLVASGPLMGAEHATAQGTATVRQELVLAEGVLDALPEGVVRLGPALAAGAFHLQATGEVDPSLRGLSDDAWSFAAGGGIDAELAVSRAVTVTGAVTALFLTPRPVIAVAESEQAVQQPLLLATLGLGVAF